MDAPKEAQVLVVEDDKDFALLIQQSLENTPGLSCVGIAAGKDEAVQLAKQLFPDIVLMDLNLSATRMDGIDAAREIRLAIRTHVVILTVYENPEVVLEASKRAFASAYIFKSQFSILPELLRAVAKGPTPQEWMIRSLILGDLSAAERAVFDIMMGKKIELFSAPKTIANQKTNILKKLGLRSQWELTQIFGDPYQK